MANTPASNIGGGGLTGCIGFVFDKLIIPATIAILGTMGGVLQWTIEQQNADADKVQEQNLYENGVVASYVNDMSALIKDGDVELVLEPCNPYTSYQATERNHTAQLLRGRTYLALSQVSTGVNRGQILRFVADVGVASVMDYRDLQFWDFSGADLQGSCLQGFELSNTTFYNTWLTLSDMDGASLVYTDLSESSLFDVGLSNANLYGANLSNSDLTRTSIADSDIRAVNFSGTNLTDVYMVDAFWDEFTIFSETTIMPDGQAWTPELDMERYTNPDSSDYWDACQVRDYIIWYCPE